MIDRRIEDPARIKILHVVGLALGGAGEHILSLATSCDPRRFESTVAMSADSPMRDQFDRAHVNVVPLALQHYGGVRGNMVAFRQLSALMKREPWDVIHTHTSVAGALGRVAARLFTRARVVHMLHTFAGHPYRSLPMRATARFVERRLDACTDYYIAGSRAMVTRGITERIFSERKVRLINNGIDLSRFPCEAAGSLPLETDWPNKKPDEIFVGSLGRLEKQKGIEFLVRAAPKVRASMPHVEFQIAGEGSLRPGLERLAESLGVTDRVHFVGWRQDSVRFLRGIDILTMPSLWEAFGLSAAEAMALRKPVIATRTDGLPEVLGDTGVLIPREDPEALADAIIELAGNAARRRAMGTRGRARVEVLFTLDRMVERHEALYERLVNQPAAEALDFDDSAHEGRSSTVAGRMVQRPLSKQPQSKTTTLPAWHALPYTKGPSR